MTDVLKRLYVFTTGSLEPETLVCKTLTNHDFTNCRTFFKVAGKDFRSDLVEVLLGTSSEAEKKIWFSSVQEQLIFISDLLNAYLFREKRKWQHHRYAGKIKNTYLYALSFIDGLLDEAERQFPDYFNKDLKLTNFRMKERLPGLRVYLHKLKNLLRERGISGDLCGIITGGLKNLIGYHPSNNDVAYIHRLYYCIHAEDVLDEASVMLILLKMDFNQSDFYLYHINQLDKYLLEVHGLHQQQERLLEWKMDLLKVQMAGPKLHPAKSSLVRNLELYFEEREQALFNLMEIRRAAASDKISVEQAFRILMDMTVPQLALFFRIQMEVGLILKEQIGEVYNFVAQHFYTDKAQFISSSNMLKLSTTIEFATVLKVHDKLSLMINWLDEQFGVRNYSR
ncbi:MAG TPA: hypothetical protein VKB19_16130 [Pedobacter sp.]|nr:hypothetical protein [Pedobacter sp.]